ncbi:beta-amyrin 28-oxidase [Tripterygium wilfordii]|uniref:Beta-amyrin 28-oxidase n=1 Tax=Tripterygium wilfordii TaxID=458696 RepID=A0A7J7C6V9_TRIWF|nr:beta-amyrin 28-oxidase [Tripterygium wilfordii]
MEIANSMGPGELLSWNDIQNMKYSWCVARESMRLASPSQGGYRVVNTDLKYESFTIPKGWKTYWTPHSTLQNPKYFEDPEKFEPFRFEGDGPSPYSYLPFGARPHICPGREIGRLWMLTFMHNLVLKFKWQTLIPDEKRKYGLAVTPGADGLPIRIHPL